MTADTITTARTPQLQACLNQIPPHLREQFLRDLDKANRLITAGWRLRKKAWDLYRHYKTQEAAR